MSISRSPITTSIAVTEEEREQAISYIEAAMRKAFQTEPPPTVGTICVARRENKIVGTLVIVSSENNEPFPVEDHYDFDLQTAPFPFRREEMVQAGRWLADERDVSLLVLKGCAEYARVHRKRYMFIEAKPYSIKRLRELGLDCTPFSNAVLLVDRIRESVGENGMRYYTEEPLPTLCMFPIAPLLERTD